MGGKAVRAAQPLLKSPKMGKGQGGKRDFSPNFATYKSPRYVARAGKGRPRGKGKSQLFSIRGAEFTRG